MYGVCLDWRSLANLQNYFDICKSIIKKAANFLAAFLFNCNCNYFPLLTEPAKSEPALNFTTFLAAILISLPV